MSRSFKYMLDKYRCNHYDELCCKDTGRELMERFFPEICPQPYYVFKKPGDIKRVKYMDRLVIKPIKKASCHGVHCLEKKDGKYYDYMKREYYDLDELVKDDIYNDGYLVEGFVKQEGVDGIPYDYKCFTFNGKVHLIAATNRNVKPSKRTFYDVDGNIIPYDKIISGIGNNRKVGETPFLRPDVAKKMIYYAEKVTAALKLFYCRVDFFETKDGPVFGEFCPRPGCYPKLTSYWDKKLGQLAHDSYKAIKFERQLGYTSGPNKRSTEGSCPHHS